MHFERVNVIVNMNHDVITTSNLFPYTAKYMFSTAGNNKTKQLRR